MVKIIVHQLIILSKKLHLPLIYNYKNLQTRPAIYAYLRIVWIGPFPIDPYNGLLSDANLVIIKMLKIFN